MSGEAEEGAYCPAPSMERDLIELAHGGGGTLMHQLLDELIRPALGLSVRDVGHDGAVLDVEGRRLAFTTDSYVVRPLFFPGGDIGSLAVHGTVNDLAMCGARPLALSVGLVIEEGLERATLQRVLTSMRLAAARASVRLATGDTKVVERGRGDGLYINTAGIGMVRAGVAPSPWQVRPGDAVLLSGDIGRHGIAVLAAREGLAFEEGPESDSAPVADSVMALIDSGIVPHCLRDPTRGGLATTLIEIARAAGVTIMLEERAVAVSDPVRGACEILGLDPLYVANEGRFVAFVAAELAERTLSVLRGAPDGENAAIVGCVGPAGQPDVLLTGLLGGTRVLDMPIHEPFPRIC